MSGIDRALKELSAGQLAAWARAEWCGEYYVPPIEIYDDKKFRALCRRLDLIAPWDKEFYVTCTGHELAFYARKLAATKIPKSPWQRIADAVRAMLAIRHDR